MGGAIVRCWCLWATVVALTGCATELPATPEARGASEVPGDMGPVMFGKTVTILTGDTSRWYKPQVRFFELMNRDSQQRYKIDVQSDDKIFIVQLPAGDYALTRVQISEGPFMSIADLDASFTISPTPATYVGTWRFGVDSPRYGRMVVISAVADEKDQTQAEGILFQQFPDLRGEKVDAVLPNPNEAQTRLYEVAPYPRVQQYFRRHYW